MMKEAKIDEADEELVDIGNAVQLGKIKLIRGWKDIRDHLGLRCSTQTVRRLARRFRMPVAYLMHKPTVMDAMLKLWWLEMQGKGLKKLPKSDTR